VSLQVRRDVVTGSDLSRLDALSWTVKRSFVHYVRRAAGQVAVIAPAYPGAAGFEFPLTGAPSDGQLIFGGGVAFRAHGGLLDVLLAEPAVVFGAGSARLLVGDAGAPLDSARRSCIAELAGPADDAPPGLVAMTPRLTDAGATLFGGVYPTGSELDPLFLPPSLIDAAGVARQATH
jgi:hypothetical protein